MTTEVGQVVGGILESAAAEWVLILSLVFGGCCSNVWALEAVLKDHPASGTFLTFAQFVFVVAQNLSTQLVWKHGGWIPRVRPRIVPLQRWMVQVVLFLAVSLINNYVFSLKIPVTLHIIFRSGGLCVSMLVGYLHGTRRYSVGQVLAGIIVTVGIIIATLATPRSTSVKTQSADFIPDLQFFAGIGLLSLALLLSAWLGLYQEGTYSRYGKQWQEGLFYTHFLSLPFFLPLHSTLTSTFRAFAASPPVSLAAVPYLPGKSVEIVPSALVALALNVFTQGLCIRGVNRLTSRVNSTTVNLVLTVRKAVSLAISVWYYGRGVSPGLLVGGGMVLAGTAIYTLAPSSVAPSKTGPKIDKAADEKSKVISDETNATSTAVNAGTQLRQRKLPSPDLRGHV